MGHPEALNQTSLAVKPSETDGSQDTHMENNVSKLIDLNSKGICDFPDLGFEVLLSSVTHLYLNYNKLTTIPCGLHEIIPNLQVLSIVGNEILQLPVDICHLSALQELFLCENQLVSLPQSLSRLKRLKILKASQNRLKSLHSELGQNECLEVLDVSRNSLNRLPATLGLLKCLCVLRASDNQLHHIPETIHFLKRLRDINFSNNQLTSLPDSFSLLENLQTIDLSKNQISSLCSMCASSHCLETIILDSNFLTCLPAWFSRLDSVREINVACNYLGQLDSFPMDFGPRLPRLCRLDLQGNCIEKLPPNLCSLSSLKFLLLGSSCENSSGQNVFQNGNWLTSFPDGLKDLKQLTCLSAEGNQLTHLPNDFGLLISLKELNIGGNLLSSLPESFCQLESLEKCQLSRNNLRYLPEDFWRLDKLRELHLNHNKLKVLPLFLRDFRQLEVLDLRQNRFTTQYTIDTFSNVKNLKVLQGDDLCGSGDLEEGESEIMDYTMDSDDDEDEDGDSEPLSFDVWSHRDMPLKDEEEESWDDDLNDSSSQNSSSEDTSEVEAGQFDLDGENNVKNNASKKLASTLTFDFYGNASQRIDLDISQHRMLPYLLHQPRQIWWQREASQEEDDQFEDA